MTGANPILPCAIDDLIPHGPSMRMVDTLVSMEEAEAKVHFTVRPGSVFVDSDGLLDETAYIEMIAQAFAATHGYYLTPAQRAEHKGLLIGVKDLVIDGQARVGDKLVITVRRVARFGDFGIVDGEVHLDNGRRLAIGQIKVWRPGEDAGKDTM